MAADKLVVDTGIFIEYLRAKDKRKTNLFAIAEKAILFTSAVSIYELYMGATTEEKREDVRKLTEDVSVLPFSDDVAIKAAEIFHGLKKTNQLIEFRDIFIAATCIVYDMPLKTINTKHFKRVQNIQLYQ